MPAIHYLSYVDRVDSRIKYFPILEDMNENQLRLALKAIVDGEFLEDAIDIAMSSFKFTGK